MRRFGEVRKAGIKYVPRPGAYAIMISGSKILLTHQAKPYSETQLPGGGIDDGESPLRALHREVMEETGYRMSVLRRLGAYQRFTYMPDYDLWAQKICHIYLARPSRQIGNPTEMGHQPIWADLRDAAQLLTSPGDSSFLSEFLGQR